MNTEAKVAVVRTHPSNVIRDYSKAMDLAGFGKSKDIPKKDAVIVKANLSWTLFFPSCSTPPWQLDGVLSKLRTDGFSKLYVVENQTVVTHPWKGAYLNKWLPIIEKHGAEFVPLTNVEWVPFKPRHELLALHEIFDEILVPKLFMNKPIIHLPTMKTHGHTVTTGAIKNAFGGLIPKYRHHAHKRIHDVLVDLLLIQKELHKSTFAVMDGCVAGDGAGPRTMRVKICNLILASGDMLAMDALSAHIMGFDPMKIDYIKKAHDLGLGCGDVRAMDIVGMEARDVLKLNFGFKVKKSPIIRFDQSLRKSTSKFRTIHKALFFSPIFKLFIQISELYHDHIWYKFIGKERILAFLDSGWGRLFESYSYGSYPAQNEVMEWDPY